MNIEKEKNLDIDNFFLRDVHSDPLFRIILKSRHFTPVIFMGIYFIFIFLINLFLSITDRHFLPDSSNFLSFTEDYGNLLSIGLIAPMGAYLFLKLHNMASSTFISLYKKGLIIITDTDFSIFLKKFSNAYGKNWLIWTSIGFSVLYNLWIVFGLHRFDTWNGCFGNGISPFYFRASVIITYYMFFILAFRSLITLSFLKRIFRLGINIKPMDPDGCCGFREVGNLSLLINSFVLLCGLYFVNISFLWKMPIKNPIFFVSIIVYLSISSYFFLTPIINGHNAIKKQKHNIMRILSEKMNERLNHHLKSDSSAHGLSSGFPSIELEYWKTVKTCPEWPLDIKIFSRFVGNALIPLLIPTLDELIVHINIINNVINFK